MNSSDGVPGWILVVVMTAGVLVGIAALIGPSEMVDVFSPILEP